MRFQLRQPLDQAKILATNPKHIVVDFDWLDLELEVRSESNFYRKVLVY